MRWVPLLFLGFVLILYYIALFWRAREAYARFRSRPRKETFSFKIVDMWAASVCLSPVFAFTGYQLEQALTRPTQFEGALLSGLFLLGVVIPSQLIGVFIQMTTESTGPTTARSDSWVSFSTVLVGALYGLTLPFTCAWDWFQRAMDLLGSTSEDEDRRYRVAQARRRRRDR